MEDRVKEEVSKLGNIEFIPVLAEDYDLINNKWIKAYGLKDLLKKGVDEIKHNIKCDLFKIRTDEISEDVEKQLKEKNSKIRAFSKERAVLFLTKRFTRTLEKEELVKFIFEMIGKCFAFFLNPLIEKLNENSLKVYKYTFEEYIGNCYDMFQDTYSEILEKFIDKLTLDFMDKQINTQKDNNENVKPQNLKNHNGFKNVIDNYLRKNFIFIAEKEFICHFFTNICEQILEENEKNLNEKISYLINNEKTIKEDVNNCFVTKYRNIESQIEEYIEGTNNPEREYVI